MKKELAKKLQEVLEHKFKLTSKQIKENYKKALEKFEKENSIK